ncbi:copper transporter [Knoellia sp. CPCC 206453]|uniref:copper transporter n=1 Tax=Knoellia pratensis TaxID=3404796 RepID=UPI003621FF69
MIDFRYHLVSIISIFMALAVGIVLGAGPLQGQIGDTLTQEVTQLREDRATLRTELEAARKAGVTRDDFTQEARARLVGGTLKDAKVALVILPDADAEDVKAVTETLAASGAAVVSRTTVKEDWVPKDAEASAQQSQLATEQRSALGLPEAAEPGAGPLDAVLATSLVAADAAAANDASRAALDALTGAKLIDVETADLVRASTAVIVAAPIKGDVVAERDRHAARLVSLSAALDRAGKGAVLTEDVGVTGFTGAASVVRAARSDASTARSLSTVDDVSLSLGQVSVVYALVQQLTGGVGQYGLGDGVSAGYPPIPAP